LIEADSNDGESVTLLLNSKENKPIILNSRASHHMVNDPQFLKKDRDVSLKISTGGLNSTLQGTATGTAILRNGVGEKIILHDVILVPDLNE
ncbi:hypothetical protein VP01_3411g3, partial [Puccinia sorghi]